MNAPVWLILSLSVSVSWSASVTNGGFEAGLIGWRFWTRDKGAGQLSLETEQARTGARSARIEHRGEQDWSLEPLERVTVQAGDIFEWEAWVRAEGEGTAMLCGSTWDKSGQAVEWSHGDQPAPAGAGWQKVRTRLLAADGITQIQPRLIGSGKLVLWVDDFSLRRLPGLAYRNTNAISPLVISNRLLRVVLNPTNATFSVGDLRTGRIWTQRVNSPGILLRHATAGKETMDMQLVHAASGLELQGRMRLEADQPELTLELAGAGEMTGALQFPHPFQTAPDDYLVIPMNEGISYPVDDKSVGLHRLIAYGGHGICMAFWGVTDGKAGHMAIFETPDDAAIRMLRLDGKLVVTPEWDPQKRMFGYTRKLRYVFFEEGGHVAIAKRYRKYAREAGLLKTLAEKRQAIPAVDQLIGAVNVWCWDKDAPELVREMQAAGIERILWSNRQSPENVKALNELGVLTSRYDIYQDVMNPAEFPNLRWKHPDWTTAAWPRDIIIGASGKFIKGWGVEAKDGSMISCGVICDRQALPYARERVPADLAEHPYRARFIDTTTAAPWHECYSPDHPMTRGESRKFKMDLLRYMSEEMKLVTGCETGHDASVPFLHYFEGMLSLGPYRVPDSGRRMQVIWTNVPDNVAKFQLGHGYRLPLWELVYHDCVVAQWYWGDYNNKLPALWDKRDLFNVLYGTPPMFMFERGLWSREKARFVKSYQTICPVVRDVGYAEMTDHRFLTPDRGVQQTVFASGHRVTVNFGATEFRLAQGETIAPLGWRVDRVELER